MPVGATVEVILMHFTGLNKYISFLNIQSLNVVRGHAVAYLAEALCYKPNSRGFDEVIGFFN
jgi:hypothetical protein